MADSKKIKEMIPFVSHQQATELLHNKFVVVLGDSIQRSVYKDLVLLLQKEKYLTAVQLKRKGEMSFEMDCLVEGGCLNPMHNGTEYREVRQYQSTHHLVRFYFTTRIYSHYMQSILQDFRQGLKPDLVIVNSCVWDISRYNSTWVDDYKKNLCNFFDEMNGILPQETLVIWSLTMPLAKKIRGGFLVPEVEHKAPHLRCDVIEANFFSATLADSYGMDVLDFHFHFRFSHQHRTNDGVHWNAFAHRRITSLLLQHAAEAWGVTMPCPVTTVEHSEAPVTQPNASKPANKTPGRHKRVRHPQFIPYHHHPPPTNYFPCEERYDIDDTELYYNFEGGPPQEPAYGYNTGSNRSHRSHRHGHLEEPYQPVHRRKYNQYRHGGHGYHFRPWHHHDPYDEHYHYEMSIWHSRPHYAPYPHYRPHPPVRHYNYY